VLHSYTDSLKREEICCISPMGDCISLVSELIPLFIKGCGCFDMNETQIKVAVVVVTRSNIFLVKLLWVYHISTGSI